MARKKILPDSNSMINVIKDPLFETFCTDRELSKRSIELYDDHLQKYCDFLEMSLLPF